MRDKHTEQNIPLIIGSSGKTGRRVVNRFIANGLGFREGTRHSDIPFDWNDKATWQQSLTNISSVYIVFSPDLAVPGAPTIIKSFVRVAKTCGVEHLVLLSGRGEEEAQTCEQVVINSSLDWTIVRSSWFAQNFSESFFLDDILRGQVYLPVADIKEPFIDAEDIADVVFAALTDEKHKGQIYELSGPELLSFREVFSEIATATDRTIDFQQISMDEYVKFMTGAGVPADYVALIKYLFTEVLDGRNAFLTDGVKRALGREPRSFIDYAKSTAATDVWGNSNSAYASA
jgi:uncharacterized protein YbjT (DUF2867 family)